MEGKVRRESDLDLREKVEDMERKLEDLSLLVNHLSRKIQAPSQHIGRKKATRPRTRQTKRKEATTFGSNETKTTKELQIEILREEHEELTERLDPSNGLMDHLVQSDVVDISDSEKMRTIKSRKDKVRYLLSRLHRYGPQRFETFIIALQETDPGVASKLQTIYNAKRNNNNNREVNCIHCLIKNRVDLGDIVDSLFTSSLIGVDVLEDHSLGKTPKEVLWNHIFFNIKTWKGEENPVRLLQISLPEDKYRDIVEVFDQLPSEQRSILCTRNEDGNGYQRVESRQSTCSRETEISSETGSVLWSETGSPTPSVKRTESFFDKRHDPTKHRMFVMRHSPIRNQRFESEGSLAHDDIALPSRKLPNVDRLTKIPPTSKTKDPRRRCIYYPSDEDLAFAFHNALNHSAGYKSYLGRRVQSFNYGQQTYPGKNWKDKHKSRDSRSTSEELL